MNQVEKYLKRAITAINDSGIANNGIVPAEYNGYISSFGASVISSGLLPAIAFYSNENSAISKERAKLMKAILMLIDENSNDSSLFSYVTSILPNTSPSLLTKQILDAAVAIKLAIRTFKLERNKE